MAAYVIYRMWQQNPPSRRHFPDLIVTLLLSAG